MSLYKLSFYWVLVVVFPLLADAYDRLEAATVFISQNKQKLEFRNQIMFRAAMRSYPDEQQLHRCPTAPLVAWSSR